MLWLWMALGAASLLSFRHSFQKELFSRLQDPVVVLWSVYAFTLPFQLPIGLRGFLAEVGSLSIQFWLLATLDIVLFLVGGYFLLQALSRGEYSKVSPIKSFTVIFSLVFSMILLGEVPNIFGIIGVCIVFLGTYMLDVKEDSRDLLGPFKHLITDRPSQFMMGFAILYSINMALTRFGLEMSSAESWVVARALIGVVIMSSLVTIKQTSRMQLRRLMTYSPWKLIVFGASGAAVVFLRTWATDLTLVSYVAAVINLQVVFDVLIGHFFFQEKHWLQRLEGSTIMVFGAAVIIFFA
jgi:drug/metabolite transporter (DMT)-like permease